MVRNPIPTRVQQQSMAHCRPSVAIGQVCDAEWVGQCAGSSSYSLFSLQLDLKLVSLGKFPLQENKKTKV